MLTCVTSRVEPPSFYFGAPKGRLLDPSSLRFDATRQGARTLRVAECTKVPIVSIVPIWDNEGWSERSSQKSRSVRPGPTLKPKSDRIRPDPSKSDLFRHNAFPKSHEFGEQT